MAAIGIHHVSINVDDVGQAVDFYIRVLGFVERPDRPTFSFGGAWLDVGDQQVHLIEMPVPTDLGQHFALEVTDLDETVNAIRSHGVEVSDPQHVGTGRQSFLHDPAGNRVELNEPNR